MTRWIETDTLSNQDISSALAIGAYTADADRLILVQWFADQVAGNGDYSSYLLHQVNGAGSSYRYIPITTAAAASGVTAIAGQSGMIAVRSGDVLTVYLDGLAGDTTTPDTIVRWFEIDAAPSAAAVADAVWDELSADGHQYPPDSFGARLANASDNISTISGDLSSARDEIAAVPAAVRVELATELAHLDADVSSVGGGLTAQETRDAMMLAPSAGTPAAGSVDAELDTILTTAQSGIGTGSGALTYTYTLTSGIDAAPIAGVDVWVSTDLVGTNIVARGVTDAFGQVVFYLDAGTYYFWRQLAGWTFTNPDTEVVA